MAKPSTVKESHRVYWEAVGSKGALPALPDGDFDAFVELLDATSSSKDAFRLVELPADPYPALVVGDARQPWTLAWAVHLAELEAFSHPAEPGTLFLADSQPDAKGHHRVYSYADGVRGMVEFAGFDDALAWMAARVQRARGKLDQAGLDAATDKHGTLLEDPHEDGTTSGFFIFEALLDAPFAEAWDAYSRGEWPVVDTPPVTFRLRRQGGWQRTLSLYLVQRFLEKRIVDFPKSLKASELDAAHRALLSNLTELEEAMNTGTLPDPIANAAKSKDAVIAERAKAWAERHDQWRKLKPPLDDADDERDDEAEAEAAPAKAPSRRGTKAKAKKETTSSIPPPMDAPDAEVADTPFMKRLRASLGPALDALAKKELIELDPDKKPAVLAEMLAAAADARSPQHLLKQLASALVHSDHVDEVFASDEQLQDFLRARLAEA